MNPTYAAIMRRVPEAQLILKYGDRYGVPALRDRFRREFAAHGVLPHRLEFRTRAETLPEHLRTMASVDLALDAFPYQGTMTSLECLAMGTPIVSCCGGYYAHRATSASDSMAERWRIRLDSHASWRPSLQPGRLVETGSLRVFALIFLALRNP